MGVRNVAVAAILVVATAKSVRAGSAFFAGPGDDPRSSAAVRSIEPSTPAYGGVSDHGVAVGIVQDHDHPRGYIGRTIVRWGPADAAPTRLLSVPNSVPDPLGGTGQAYVWPQIGRNGTVAIEYDVVSADLQRSLGVRAYRVDPGTSSATLLNAWSPSSTASEDLDRSAVGVSDTGYVVGWSSIDANGFGPCTRATVWAPTSSTATPLASPLTVDDSTAVLAYAMNDRGMIGGLARRYDRSTTGDLIHRGARVVRWASPTAVPVELESLSVRTSDGFASAFIRDLSDAGTIVGVAQKFDAAGNDQGVRPVRWDAGGTAVTELQWPGADPGAAASTVLLTINGSETVVGTLRDQRRVNFDQLQAVRWDAGSDVAVPLTAAGIVTQSVASSVNDRGTIVGNVWSEREGQRAVIWLDGSTHATDLSVLVDAPDGWTLINACGVSHTGFITGIANVRSSQTHSYTRLFTALVPQAGTYGRGDANFDTKVDFHDLLVLAAHFNRPSNGATDAADFDLDGVTDFDDLLTLAAHFNTLPTRAQVASLDEAFAAQFALAQSIVPEPTAFVLAMAFLALPRRRA